MERLDNLAKLYSLDWKYIRDMVQMTGDTTAITRMGSSIKNLGYAQIVMMIAGIIIGAVMASSIVGIAMRSGSIEEFLLDFKGTLRVFLIMLLMVSLVGIFFIFRLYQSLIFIKVDSEYTNSSIDRAGKLFAAVIFLQIIGVFVGLYFINSIIQDLDNLARNDPTVEGFEDFANELSVSGEIIISSIMGIAISLMMLGGFNSIKDWTIDLHRTTGILGFVEASNKLGNVNIGILILIAGQIFNLISLGAFGDLFEFIGVIVLLISYIQVGNRLENIPFNISDRSAITGLSSHETDPYAAKLALTMTQTSSEEQYCTTCGYKNPFRSNFCNSCGTKLI